MEDVTSPDDVHATFTELFGSQTVCEPSVSQILINQTARLIKLEKAYNVNNPSMSKKAKKEIATLQEEQQLMQKMLENIKEKAANMVIFHLGKTPQDQGDAGAAAQNGCCDKPDARVSTPDGKLEGINTQAKELTEPEKIDNFGEENDRKVVRMRRKYKTMGSLREAFNPHLEDLNNNTDKVTERKVGRSNSVKMRIKEYEAMTVNRRASTGSSVKSRGSSLPQ